MYSLPNNTSTNKPSMTYNGDDDHDDDKPTNILNVYNVVSSDTNALTTTNLNHINTSTIPTIYNNNNNNTIHNPKRYSLTNHVTMPNPIQINSNALNVPRLYENNVDTLNDNNLLTRF